MFKEPKNYRRDPEERRRRVKELYGEEYEPEDIRGLDVPTLFMLQVLNSKDSKNYLFDEDDSGD